MIRMLRWKVGDAVLDLVQDDITRAEAGAVVNAANARLAGGGGVDGAIHRAAGPELDAECRAHAPIEPGSCVVTGAHALPNKAVIHCLGPVYGRDEPAAELLAACYKTALDAADYHGLRSVAFPALSTGAFGYPLEDAADIATRTVLEKAAAVTAVQHIRFVLFDEEAARVHGAALDRNLDMLREQRR
jgi:O-acetyl-ADP-ribose deacetylase (regulator of RNase III)